MPKSTSNLSELRPSSSVAASSTRKRSNSFSSDSLELAPTEVDLLTGDVERRAVCLRPEWNSILSDLFSLGCIRQLTTGRGAFIERVGPYPIPEFTASMAELYDGTFELRHDLSRWGRGFAVYPNLQPGAALRECGLHFFNRCGTAIHRIFLSPAGSIEAFERIAEEYGETDERQAPLPPEQGKVIPTSTRDFRASNELLVLDCPMFCTSEELV